MSAQRKTQVELDLLGAQARHHMIAADRYMKKAGEHHMAAAICLLEARGSIFPNYDPLARTSQAKALMDKWHAWLELHGIPESTARRLIREHEDPHALELRRESDRKRDEERAQAVAAMRKRQETAISPDHHPVDNSPAPQQERPQRTAIVFDIDIRRALAVAKPFITPERKAQVLALLNSFID